MNDLIWIMFHDETKKNMCRKNVNHEVFFTHLKFYKPSEQSKKALIANKKQAIICVAILIIRFISVLNCQTTWNVMKLSMIINMYIRRQPLIFWEWQWLQYWQFFKLCWHNSKVGCVFIGVQFHWTWYIDYGTTKHVKGNEDVVIKIRKRRWHCHNQNGRGKILCNQVGSLVDKGIQVLFNVHCLFCEWIFRSLDERCSKQIKWVICFECLLRYIFRSCH